MTKNDDYKQAKNNAARKIIALVAIKKSVEKVIEELKVEDFNSISVFCSYLNEKQNRVQELSITIRRLITDVKFYQQCISRRASNTNTIDY